MRHQLHPEPAEVVPLSGRDDTALVRFADAEGPAAWGFRHVCTSWPDDAEPDGTFTKVVAPRLSRHTVTRTDAGVTVRASVLCPDCGTHGWVTDSQWRAA